MDIYEYAKEYDADYMDINRGLIYRVQNYNYAVKNGLPTNGIEIVDIDSGEHIGYAKKIDK